MSALEATEYGSIHMRDSFNGYLIRQIAVNLGLVCGWGADPPERLTKSQLRVGIGQTTGADVSANSIKKDALYEIAKFVGAPVRPRTHQETATDLRRKIAAEAGFELDEDRTANEFKKDQLQRILMETAKRELEQKQSEKK